MEMKIYSRKYKKTFNFYMDSNGGYVYLCNLINSYNMKQICKGGGFTGSTLTATPETFDRICRGWYNAHCKNVLTFLDPLA